jgi:hypothetical protein
MSEDNNKKYQSFNLNGTTCKCLMTEIFTCSYTSKARSLLISLVRTLQRTAFLSISKAIH